MGGTPGVINPSLPNSANPTSSTWELNNNGQYTVGDGVGGTATGNWVTPTSFAALYQAKTDVTGGSFSADPSAGSYVDLSSNRQWSRLAAGTVTFTVTIREKVTGIVRSIQAGKTLTVT